MAAVTLIDRCRYKQLHQCVPAKLDFEPVAASALALQSFMINITFKTQQIFQKLLKIV